MSTPENNVQITSISNNNYNIEWTLEHEDILVEWADKAMCYRWLHARSHTLYSNLNTWYTIPVIIISTLTGTANFAQDRVPDQYQSFFVMIIGCFNILAGIVTTIQQFLKITQLNEAHRVSSISWDKFYRNIKIELAKHPDERMPVTQMIKISKEEFDRLMETSPNIPDKIIQSFKLEFNSNNEQSKIITPEICDVLVSTELSRNPWASEENKSKKINKLINKEKQNLDIILNFQKTFYDINNREPLSKSVLAKNACKIEINVLTNTLEQIKKNDIDIQSIEISNKINKSENLHSIV